MSTSHLWQRITISAPLAFALVQTCAQASTPLSWEQCVRFAAGRNADIRVAAQALAAAEAQVNGAHSGYLPQLAANLGYTYGTSSSSVFTSNPQTNTTGLSGASSSASGNYTANATLTQNLFAGFADKGRLEQAQAQLRVAQAQLKTAHAKASYDLKSAYTGLGYAENYVKLAHDIVRRRSDNMSLVDLRFQSGRENKGAVLLSKAYFRQAQYEELLARDSIEIAQATLGKVIGLDNDSEFASLSATEGVPVQDPPAATPEFQGLAVSTPDHLIAQAQESASDAAILVAKSGFYPSLNLTGTYGRQGADFFPQGERWSAGLGISFPLFSGGKDYYSAHAAVASWAQSTEARVNVDRQLLVTLRQTFRAYAQAVQKLSVDQAFVEATSTRSEIARNKYNTGLQTFDEWDTIENDLINRQKTEIQSRRDRVVAEAAWEQAQGKGAIP
jgi:outer membrane protein